MLRAQDHYSYLVLIAAALELVGGSLFVLNVKFGAVLLVSPRTWLWRARRLAAPCAHQ